MTSPLLNAIIALREAAAELNLQIRQAQSIDLEDARRIVHHARMAEGWLAGIRLLLDSSRPPADEEE